MRSLLLSLSLIVISAFILNSFIEKRFDFAGASGELRPEIVQNLPLSKHWLWWRFNLRAVSDLLEQDPRILSAKVEMCDDRKWYELGCFSIDVTERTPAFVVSSEDVMWLATEDGALLRRVEADDLADSLPKVESVFMDSPTSEIVRARFRFLIRAIRICEEEVMKRVTSVRWIGNGEFGVSFDGMRFESLFSGSQNDVETVRAEAKRLRKLLRHYAGREVEIGGIDLAYRRVAVVSPNIAVDNSAKSPKSQ